MSPLADWALWSLSPARTPPGTKRASRDGLRIGEPSAFGIWNPPAGQDLPFEPFDVSFKVYHLAVSVLHALSNSESRTPFWGRV